MLLAQLSLSTAQRVAGNSLRIPLEGQCVVCKSPLDLDRENARYNQIRLDLEIQIRESGQLIRQKESELDATRKSLRLVRREHTKHLSMFDLKYSGANGPREAFLATRINRLGHIDAEIEFLTRSLDIAKEISELISKKAASVESIELLKTRNKSLRREAQKRRAVALTRVSDFGAAILRSDLPAATGVYCCRKCHYRLPERLDLGCRFS